jgi:hypothetical protein
MKDFALFGFTFVGSLVLYVLANTVIFGPLAEKLSRRHDTIKRTGDCRHGCPACLLVEATP